MHIYFKNGELMTALPQKVIRKMPFSPLLWLSAGRGNLFHIFLAHLPAYVSFFFFFNVIVKLIVRLNILENRIFIQRLRFHCTIRVFSRIEVKLRIIRIIKFKLAYIISLLCEYLFISRKQYEFYYYISFDVNFIWIIIEYLIVFRMK